MALSTKAQAFSEKAAATTKLGELRKLAKELKTDHDLALELWSTGGRQARRLAVLIMDKKRFDQELVDRLDADLQEIDFTERTQLMDWVLANQLSKTAAGARLMESWRQSPSALQRRTFWYYQARLRWTGQTPPENTRELVDALERDMASECAEVLWAMNFAAGWIGVHEAEYRDRCIALGESTGAFREEKAPKGCTPNYLPEFIRIQVEKLG